MIDSWIEWLQPYEDAEVAAWRLWELGAVAVEEREHLDGVLLVAGFDDSHDLRGVAAACVGSVIVHAQRSWDNAWKQHARRYEAFPGMWIEPAWASTGPPQSDVIVLDPGVSFGFDHATTRLCLTALGEWVRPASSVLDVGCGSGVLAIAAARFGARSVEAIDIAPEAVRDTRRNVERNHVDANVAVSDRSLTAFTTQYDVVVANLGGGSVLAELALDLQRVVRSGGVLIVSGLLDVNLDSVAGAFAQWRRLTQRASDGWHCIVMQPPES